MANRYKHTFISYEGRTFTIYVDDSAFSGTPITFEAAAPGFELQYEGEAKTATNPIMASSVTVPMVVDSADIDALITDLVGASEERFTIKITVNPAPGETLFWAGYVLPDISRMEDASYQGKRVFSLVATDGIGRLKDIEYKQTVLGNDLPYGYRTALQHIVECLKEGHPVAQYYTAGTEFIYTVVNWWESGHGGASTSKDPLALTQVNGNNFATRRNSQSEWAFMSCYEVVKQICIHFKARLYYSYGIFRFEQINERANTTVTQRKWSSTLAGMGSSNSVSYEKIMDQTADGARLSGGVYEFLPALRNVVVEYEHRTAKNYLAGTNWKWKKSGTGTANDALVLSNLDFDADSILRITGRVRCKLTGPVNDRWRYEFALTITTNNGEIYRNLASNVDPNLLVINHEAGAWEVSTVRAEITTDFQTTADFDGYVNFAFETPVLPSGTNELTIDFAPYGGWDNEVPENAVAVTLSEWSFEDLVLIVQNADDASNYEYKKTYQAINAQDGNSKTLRVSSIFGHAVKPWTDTKLKVSANGSTWVDTTATWGRGASGAQEFGGLLAAELLVGQTRPVMTFDTKFVGTNFSAHTRLTTDGDSMTWLMLRGKFSAQDESLEGEWFNAGVNDEDNGGVETDTDGPPPDQPIITMPPEGHFNPKASVKMRTGSDLALAILAENYTSAALSAGAITSVPVIAGIKANTYVTDDQILIVNPNTGKSDVLTVTANVTEGATSIAVSGTLSAAYPYSSIILTSKFVKSTTGFGDGASVLPPGATGQILRHDGTKWTAYSGTVDGRVLTWDSTNGWQEEAISGGGSGTVTSVGLTMPSVFSVSGSPVTTAGTLAVSLVSQSANQVWAGPLSGGAATPTFRALVAADIPALDTGKITTGILPIARGGTGMGTLGAPLQMIRVNSAGTALEYFAPVTLTGALTAGRIPYATGSNSLADDSALIWDQTTRRVGLGAATPQAIVDIGLISGTGTTVEAIRVNLSSSVQTRVLLDQQGQGATVLELRTLTGGADPYVRFATTTSGSNTTQYACGIDNSDADKLKFTPGALPGGQANRGICMTNDTAPLHGINKDAPAYPLDVSGKVRGTVFFGSFETWPAASLSTGAGTGATYSILGSGNGIFLTVTTGTAPASNGTIITINLPTNAIFPTVCMPAWAPANQQTANDIIKAYISSTGNNSFTIKANTSLQANAIYAWWIVLAGY